MAEPDAPHAPAFRHALANHPCLGAVCADPVGAALEAGAEGPPTRHVVFLNSYRHGLEWSDDLVRGVQAVLEAQTYPVAFSVEHMDSGRFSGPTYEAQLQGLLRLKYSGRPLDAIIAADDEALKFLLEHRDELFPGTSVVFMGINNPELIARADPASYTGLREDLRTGDIVDLATTLRPATRRIVVVGDATSTAAAQLDTYRAVAVRRPDLAFVFLDGGRSSLEQIIEGLRDTSATDAVVTTAFTRDFNGRYFPRVDALARIWIWVYSEVEQGTTFKIHLPATDAPAAVQPPVSPKFIRASSGETVLLVEDQDDVRNLSLRILEREGYVMLSAASGQAALTLATSHDGRIHLLTDVVMPGLSGREVAEQLAALRPGIRVLFNVGLHRQRDRPARRPGPWHGVSVQALHARNPGGQGT